MRDVDSPDFWQSIYRQGNLGWDLGGPTPVFHRLLISGQLPPGRLIVLGAGQGHDARLFAQYGFDVTAVDFAPGAVRAMQERNVDGRASVTVLQRDIFKLPAQIMGTFDYVLEYTCYCAIAPERRDEYAELVADLLKPGGVFVALAFPLDGGSGGPPFPVSTDEFIQGLQAKGLVLQRREVPPDSVPQRKGREELIILSKGEVRSQRAGERR